MAFFSRTKKVKKDSTPAKDHKPTSRKNRAPPPPPSQAPQWHSGGPYQQLAPFQPAGLLPPPPGWKGGSQPPTPYSAPSPYPPIIVNQHHYYLGAPAFRPASGHHRTASRPLTDLGVDSAVDFAKEIYHATRIPQLLNDALPLWHGRGSHRPGQGNALVDQISDQLDNVLTMIDEGCYNGQEHDIFAWQPVPGLTQASPLGAPVSDRAPRKSGKKSHQKAHPKGQTTAAAAVVSESFFAKVDRYANSRLPMNLPPLILYIPTYPLVCLAAQYSERVYDPPSGSAERNTHVDADWRTGTKAMVIKSVPMDYMNTIVLAIRGTATFMDWAVNLKMDPTSPAGFLDDPGNLCHAGFLSVARNMIRPVARRLRQLLEEDSGRASYSLLITGHSAGGAVAALLYSHMLATSRSAESDLNEVAGCFRRIHCITFGTPPVSLMPLATPDDLGRRPQLRKSVFLGFVNEGDPVTRADKAYVKSLLELFALPGPRLPSEKPRAADNAGKKPSRGDRAGSSRVPKKQETVTGSSSAPKAKSGAGPVWRVPPCTLSCAGRIVVLRSGDSKARLRGKKTTVAERLREGVVAQMATDEQLRSVIWGDPVAHMMRLYAGRVEMLAVAAVTGRAR